MFQIQIRETHYEELQRKTIDEETKGLRRIRQSRRRQKEEGFWRRSQVGTVQEINVNSPMKYIIPK